MSHDYDPTLDLSAYDNDYAVAQPEERSEIPDGKYQVRIETVRLTRSQKGDPMIKWDLVVISGASSGRHLFKNSVITPPALAIVKGELQTVGIDLVKFSELPQRLEELLDRQLEVTKRTKGDYTNVYFNKRLEIPADSIPANADLPF